MQRNSLKKKTATGNVKRKKMALGKGLEALIPGIEKEEDAKQDFFYCDIDLIRPNRFQPRATFSEEDLQELADSIKTQGVLQVIVRSYNGHSHTRPACHRFNHQGQADLLHTGGYIHIVTAVVNNIGWHGKTGLFVKLLGDRFVHGERTSKDT